MAEENVSGKRGEVTLLYVAPGPNPTKRIASQIKVKPDEIALLDTDELINSIRNKTVREFLSGNREHFADLQKRLRLRSTSWLSLHDQIVGISSNLADGAGDQTLRNVLDGFAEAIRLHPRSGVPDNAA